MFFVRCNGRFPEWDNMGHDDKATAEARASAYLGSSSFSACLSEPHAFCINSSGKSEGQAALKAFIACISRDQRTDLQPMRSSLVTGKPPEADDAYSRYVLPGSPHRALQMTVR